MQVTKIFLPKLHRHHNPHPWKWFKLQKWLTEFLRRFPCTCNSRLDSESESGSKRGPFAAQRRFASRLFFCVRHPPDPGPIHTPHLCEFAATSARQTHFTLSHCHSPLTTSEPSLATPTQWVPGGEEGWKPRSPLHALRWWPQPKDRRFEFNPKIFYRNTLERKKNKKNGQVNFVSLRIA